MKKNLIIFMLVSCIILLSCIKDLNKSDNRINPSNNQIHYDLDMVKSQGIRIELISSEIGVITLYSFDSTYLSFNQILGKPNEDKYVVSEPYPELRGLSSLRGLLNAPTTRYISVSGLNLTKEEFLAKSDSMIEVEKIRRTSW